jgi:hypothetical protein
MTGNTADAWSYCSSRSDSDMLRVWFSRSPFVPSDCGVKTVVTQRFAPRTLNINAQSCINFRNSCPTVSKNYCLITLHVLFVCESGWASASTTLVGLLLNISIHSHTLQCGKHFCPYLTANFRSISAHFIPSDTKKCTIAFCLSLVQTSSESVGFMPCSLGIHGL